MSRARNDAGTATLWVLGLCVALMFLGGFGVDLWHAIDTRRELSSMADAAASAGADALDEASLRAGYVRLDSLRARELALATLEAFPSSRSLDMVTVDVDGSRVTVTLRGHVAFSLLRVFARERGTDVVAHASAEPRLRP